jgi:signal transduction histidine kinase
MELKPESFDMRPLVEGSIQTLSPLAEQKKLGLTAEIEPDVGELTSDRNRVEQILINLINNALKFTYTGSVHVTCVIAGDTVETSVIDTGIGIKQEDMEHLFETFRQLDSGLTRKEEGSGLGLAISSQLAHLLGGEIRVSSEPGKGSRFTLVLPLSGETAGS